MHSTLSRRWYRGITIPLCIGIILLLRFISTFTMGLMPQDAYYSCLYGEHLSLSYYDHPPLIGYMLWFFERIFGKTVFAVKIADSITTLLTIWAFYHLCKLFLSPHKVRRAMILLLSTFMVTILSLVSTPDVPLMLCWTLSLTALHQAIFRNRPAWWLVAGVCMGLAFDSKYTGVFLPFGMLAFLVLTPTRRRLLRHWGPWTAIIIFSLLIVPVVVWNVQHDFASFRFQSEDRAGSISHFTLNPSYFLGVLGHQSAILTPVLFFALVFFLGKTVRNVLRRQGRLSEETMFLLAFFVPVFAGFLAISLVYWVKLNWLMPAYITGIILVARYLPDRWVGIQAIVALVIHLALAVEIFFYPVPIRSDDTWFGWKRLARHVDHIHQLDPAAFVFSADENKTSSVLNFYSDSMVYSQNVIGENGLQFDYIGYDVRALEGRDAFFINSIPNFKSEAKENNYPPKLTRYFDTITELDPILIKKDSRTMRKFLVFYCTNYHPQPAPLTRSGTR